MLEQEFGVVGQMLAGNGEHRRILMSQQDRNGQRVEPLFEHPRRETVTERVEAILCADLFLEPLEAAANRLAVPRLALGIPKNGPVGTTEYTMVGDIQSLLGEIHDAGTFFSFGFLERKDPSLIR
ncbi:MAG: hypothetical protein R6U98_03445 [Pirellulaceae bacterium]